MELVPADGSIALVKLTTAVQNLINGALQRSGGTMTGDIVLIDDGQPVPPGAVLASTIPMPDVVNAPPQITEAQAAKLIAFLKANPDIVAAAQL